MAVNKLISYLPNTKKIIPDDINTDPQIGFKVFYSQSKKTFRVKVIGAKLLPVSCSGVKPYGYSVKITLFPEKEKFETKIVEESWPTFNEEFEFQTSANLKNQDAFRNKFVSFTIYAMLKKIDYSSRGSRKNNTLKRFFTFNENDIRLREHDNSSAKSSRFSLGNRHTIGAVQYNLDSGLFTQKVDYDVVSTPDIWRSIQDIKYGKSTAPREGLKGNIELTMQYALSEDGSNDVVEITVSRFRCNLQTMQEHQKLGGKFYVKITACATDSEDALIQKMKSDVFDPTISLKIEANSGTLRANLNKNSQNLNILIRLINKNMIGKKTVVGRIEINKHSEIWKKIIETPSVPVTRNVNFE